MRVSLGNVHAVVEAATDDEMRWLREYLTFDTGKERYSGAPPLRLLNMFSRAFPAGLLSGAVRSAAADRVAIEVRDERAAPCSAVPLPPELVAKLRDYQAGAVEAAVRSTRGIVALPTGSGKTLVFAALAMSLPCRWLFVVHRLDLVEQALETFEEASGERVGRVGSGCWEERRVTCATYQALGAALRSKKPEVVARCADFLVRVQAVAADEAHTAAASTFWGALMRCVNAYWRFGLSATPKQRGDQRTAYAVGALGPVIYRRRASALVEEGVLARPRIRFMVVETPDIPRPPPRFDATGLVVGRGTEVLETQRQAYLLGVVRSDVRNEALVLAAAQAAKPCLMFIQEIEHGHALAGRLAAAGLSQEFVWGDVPAAERRDAVARLERGKSEVLVASRVFVEGVDIPSLASVINAAGGRSAIAALQRLGRGMRTDGGRKTEFEVIDVEDVGHPMLERQSRARRKAYASEGHEVRYY